MPGADVGASHRGLLAAAGDRTRGPRLGVIQHRADSGERTWTVGHDGQLAPHENEGGGGVSLVLRRRPRWHPAVVSDEALHEILCERVSVQGRVVNQVAGDV